MSVQDPAPGDVGHSADVEMSARTRVRRARDTSTLKCHCVFSQRIDPTTLETLDARWVCRYCGAELKP